MAGDESGENEAPPPSPTVFVSYSHDSPEHKMWVAGLATDLRRHSVDAILDQWRLRPGMDIPSFMERGIRDSNRVVIVCTPQYARKADAGKGGVGYEKMIVTGELYKDLGSDKFVPVLVSGEETDALPSFLKGRYYVDFRNAGQYAEKLEELVRALLQVPKQAEPPLGPPPFAQGPQEKDLFPGALIEQPVELPTAGSPPPEEVYDTCRRLFRRGDAVGWYELVKLVRTPVEKNLLEWRKVFSEQGKAKTANLYPTIDEGVGVVAPLLALALASVESRQTPFNDQRSVLDDLIQISDWPRPWGSLMVVVGMLEALGYVYNYLHGATCLATGQLEVAIRFATMRVCYQGMVGPLWKEHQLVGWPGGFEEDAKKAWDYIEEAMERHPWLGRVFPRPAAYSHALAAYCMVLSAIEYAELLSRPQAAEKILAGQQQFSFDVPPMFAYLPRAVLEQAFTTAFRDATAVELVAATSSVAPQLLRKHWRDWNAVLVKAMPRRYPVRRVDLDHIWIGELP